jgi:mRNA interferase MazF
MKRAGQVVVFRFPQTDLVRGKLRPALILGKLPGQHDDWLVCMISTQLTQQVEGFDEIIREGDVDFERSGLKAASVIRLGRLAVVDGKMLIGATGEIDAERLERLKSNFAHWIIQKEGV